MIKRSWKKLEKVFTNSDISFLKQKSIRTEKSFYDIKNYRYFSASEIEEARESLNKLKKSLKLKKFYGNVDSVYYHDVDNYDDNYNFADYDDEYRKNESVRRLFKEFDRDYYKPIRTEYGFGGRENNYIEYNSRGDRYEILSPE